MMVMKALTKEEVLALPVTVDVATAGKAFGIGSTKARELARAEQFPCQVLPLGKGRRVTRAAILKALGIKDPDAVPDRSDGHAA